MGPNLTPESRQLLVRQRSVIASWQAVSVGLTLRQLRWACRTGWQPVTAHTFLAADGDISEAQMRVAGVLEAGPDAALAGCSALIEAGWTGDANGYVDVVVARGHRSRRTPPPPWLRMHTTLDVPRRLAAPPRTTAARAAVDAGSWARSARERLFILASTAQQRLATVEQMRRELASRPNLAWSAQMRDTLDEVAAGATSTHEADFRRECRRRGLPEPRMQVRRRAGGRGRRTDAEFTTSSGRLVIVEIDGVAHMDVAQWQADLSRQNDLSAETGALVLHLTGWELRHDPDPFFSLLARVLAGSV